jgi:hypothetical protein
MESNMNKLKNLKVSTFELQLIKEGCRMKIEHYKNCDDADYKKLIPVLRGIIRNVDSAKSR